MIWLEIIIFIIMLYIITQLLLPFLFPKVFERNWIFKRDKMREDVNNTIRNYENLKEIKKDLKDIEE